MTTGPNNFTAPTTRAEAVATQLRKEIASGVLAPGAPIRDAEIAARLGVSITPVRESIAVLISEGLVDLLPNKRRRVMSMTQHQAEELMDALGALMSLGMARINGATQDTSRLRAIMLTVGQGIEHPERRPVEGGPVAQMVDEIFTLAGNSELKFLVQQLSTRISGRLSLYPYRHHARLWDEAFTRIAATLPDTQAAAELITEFFDRLVEAMSHDRHRDQVVSPQR